MEEEEKESGGGSRRAVEEMEFEENRRGRGKELEEIGQ